MAEVHARLRAEGARRGGLVATTVVLVLVRDGHFVCLWAGDSRAYLLREGVLVPLTRDHSLVRELVDAGTIGAAEAERHPHANVITRAVGAEVDGVDLDKVTGELQALHGGQAAENFLSQLGRASFEFANFLGDIDAAAVTVN